jgi:hydrophobic/amphiphilic exporter-1 (mainly G- bacteria), HAE1 family
MSGLTRLAIKRPLTMLMLILGLIILGLRGYGMLKVDRYPTVNLPFVAVITTYAGAAPEDIESEIVKPIEDAVAGVSGVDTVSSTSKESVGMVQIAFKEGVDGNQAATDVERAVNGIKSTLPTDADEPTIVKADLNALAMMNIVLSGKNVTLEDLYHVADQTVKPRLQASPGVAAVTVSGGLEREIQVQVDPTKMAGYQVSLAQVGTVLARENIDVPSGAISAGASRTAIRSLGRFSSLEEIGNVIVTSGSKRVYLKDLSSVTDTHKDVEEILRLNGQETVGLAIT